MKKSILLGAGVGVLGIAAYLYLKNKKSLEIPAITGSNILENPLDTANEPTQLLGTKLPDGTTATGASSIAQAPVDVINKNTVNSTLATIVWQVDNSIEANRLSAYIAERISAIPNYKTASTKRAVNKDIYDSTQKMFDLGYAPDLKGRVYKINKIQGSNAEANGYSKLILSKINALPNYKTKGTLTSINKEIKDLTEKMFSLGYVPDLKGGSYPIVK